VIAVAFVILALLAARAVVKAIRKSFQKLFSLGEKLAVPEKPPR